MMNKQREIVYALRKDALLSETRNTIKNAIFAEYEKVLQEPADAEPTA